MSFIEFIQQGGPVIVLILLGSVVALAVFLERIYYLRESYHLPKETLRKLEQLDPASTKSFEDHLRTNQKPFHEVLLKMIEWREQPRSEMIERLNPLLTRTREKFSRGVDVLSTIASISPLMGLLGTVLGMMHVFQAISSQGLGNPNQLAGGISEALLTTIAGLIVAIPTFVAFKFLNARADHILRNMEQIINKSFETLVSSGAKSRS